MENTKQTEEMAVKCCRRNPQAYTTEECLECEFKNGMCDSYRLAKILYEEGYRKVSDVVDEIIDFLFEVEKLESLYAGQREARGVKCAINKLKEKYKVDVKNG